MAQVRRVQRVAAYAVILREDRILLSRLARRLTTNELWTLPGGGIEHGEDPRDAVVREVQEETGLDVEIGETAHVYSFHARNSWRQGRRADAHSLRIVYDGWVPVDAPDPRVVEVDGSTMEAAWKPVAEVLSGRVPTVALVTEVLAEHRAHQMQRVAAYALLVRHGSEGEEVLLTRLSHLGAQPGRWTLPGGGVDHGESPREALIREVREECGLECEVGEVLDVDDTHFDGTAPTGRREDFHGIHLIYGATVVGTADPMLAETDGTTDAVAWIPITTLDDGSTPVLGVVSHALSARARRRLGG